MSANPYDQSLLDLIKKNSSTVIKSLVGLALLIAIIFAIRIYTNPNKGANAQIDGKNFVSSHNYSEGNKSANLKIVEYFDYECHVCQGFEPIRKDFLKEYSNKVEMFYKHLPIIGINSRSAAEATQAAGEQGKFLEYKEAVYKIATQKSVLNNESLTQIAKDQNLDIDKWNQRRNSKEIKDQVAEDIKTIQNAKLPPSSRGGGTKGGEATPGFVLIKNNEIVDWWSGSLSLADLKVIIDKNL